MTRLAAAHTARSGYTSWSNKNNARSPSPPPVSVPTRLLQRGCNAGLRTRPEPMVTHPMNPTPPLTVAARQATLRIHPRS